MYLALDKRKNRSQLSERFGRKGVLPFAVARASNVGVVAFTVARRQQQCAAHIAGEWCILSISILSHQTHSHYIKLVDFMRIRW